MFRWRRIRSSMVIDGIPLAVTVVRLVARAQVRGSGLKQLTTNHSPMYATK